MISPPYRPRKRSTPDPHAAEKAEAGNWPYCYGRGVTTRQPQRVLQDGEEIAVIRRYPILVAAGEVED